MGEPSLVRGPVDLPKLGGRLRERQAAAATRAAARDLPKRTPATKVHPGFKALSKAEKAAGRSQVSRVLATKLGARLLPALAIALTVKEVGTAVKEGVGAYTAYKDLERTREVMQRRYGTKKRAKATREARTRRR
jgi:hypothetical protein